MPDRGKVIKALEVCVNNGFTSCEGCPYDYPDRVGCQAIDDALALLKEQEAVVRCKDCKHNAQCEIAFGCNGNLEWYCADGERVE